MVPQPIAEVHASVAGAGTGLMTIDYRVYNTSATESFTTFRFMLFTNPDGDRRLSGHAVRAWGIAAVGDPCRVRAVSSIRQIPFSARFP